VVHDLFIEAEKVGIGIDKPDYKLQVEGAVMLADMAQPLSISGYSGIYSSAGELHALDASGNATVISPHHFSLISKSEPMAWAFYSENSKLNEKINVDMLRVIRLVEQMSGEKLVVIKNTKTNKLIGNSMTKQSLVKKVKEQQKTIEQLKKQNREILKRLKRLEKKVK
jgi:hypothetical protein